GGRSGCAVRGPRVPWRQHVGFLSLDAAVARAGAAPLELRDVRVATTGRPVVRPVRSQCMSSCQGPVLAAGRGAGLLANRNFTLLWAGDALSEVGSQATSVTMPLLVLALTGSPAKAGLVGLARSLAYPLTPLPAGGPVDLLDRRG